MAYDLEEQEKLDALRAWWERYGTLCLTLLFLVVAAILGWRGWQWYQSHQASQAMGYFEALQTAAVDNDTDSAARIKAASETLREKFPKSGYASRGVLIAAHALHERKDLEGARTQLDWLVKNNTDAALTPLARLRLAGLLLEQEQYDQALAQLSNAPAEFEALYADRRGDVLYAQGKKEDARAAWENAVKLLGAQPAAQIIQLKIDALGDA
ncbi:YfgM family protein [Paracandidimonas soli]|uniref:Ancillary SecYEG translocon subunit n=1 Tax=Paracandidimonas soli TaxID=1917182 RepID=A0A4R3URH9_9BURK|nr:tetratricopeptide repeat protein [Paracandidimonas soli]TCU94525.1 putative negative regulator of RcsB-dependent stress response [Paracandidimonas soli]